MRKLLSCLSFFLILFSFAKKTDAQPQWKFHVAFEDATGAKDTIWCIWDSSAHGTLPTDTVFKEGAVIFDHNVFNVWIYNYDGDSTKTRAVPFSWSLSLEVRAFNYQYPLTISWDTSLFNEIFPWPYASVDYARIDNGYFFYVNNTFLDHNYNMLIDNKVSAPSFNWFSQDQFPMSFSIARLDTSYTTIDKLNLNQIKIFPNPTSNNISIVSSDVLKKIEIFSETGNKIITKEFSGSSQGNCYFISLDDVSSGYYLINIFNFKNHIYHAKIIKTP